MSACVSVDTLKSQRYVYFYAIKCYRVHRRQRFRTKWNSVIRHEERYYPTRKKVFGSSGCDIRTWTQSTKQQHWHVCSFLSGYWSACGVDKCLIGVRLRNRRLLLQKLKSKNRFSDAVWKRWTGGERWSERAKTCKHRYGKWSRADWTDHHVAANQLCLRDDVTPERFKQTVNRKTSSQRLGSNCWTANPL